MEILLLIGIIIFFLVLLVKSAELVEGAFVFLARKIHISEFFIGFVVLSIITSLPEMSISVLSSQDIPELSIGNLIGASTVLLTLVIGLSAIKYKTLIFKGRFSEKEVVMGIGLIASMILVLWDKYISVDEGLLLLGGYLFYVFYLNHKFNKDIIKKNSSLNIHKLFHSFGRAGIGIIILLISSSIIVRSASHLAGLLSISPALIGLLLLAIGTNLPELTILFISKQNVGDQKLALGNIFGSACVNPGILGLLAVLAGGVKVDSFISIVPSLVILSFTLVLFGIATWTGRQVTRFEGILLISLYISLIIAELLIILHI